MRVGAQPALHLHRLLEVVGRSATQTQLAANQGLAHAQTHRTRCLAYLGGTNGGGGLEVVVGCGCGCTGSSGVGVPGLELRLLGVQTP